MMWTKIFIFSFIISAPAFALDDPYEWQGDQSQYNGRDLEAEARANYESLPEDVKAEANKVVEELRDNRDKYSVADQLAETILNRMRNMTDDQRRAMQDEANAYILDIAKEQHNLSDQDLESLKKGLEAHQLPWHNVDQQ